LVVLESAAADRVEAGRKRKPLSFPCSFEEADTFTWHYLEEGPEIWRVETGKA
jgi:uncharacterized protein (DUF2249 family)